MKEINEAEAKEAAKTLFNFCNEQPKCSNCIFFDNGCVLKFPCSWELMEV
ncbi:MAG: hypothetical protein IK122_02675 [Alphaproteobacteria bacterium]|nr:hypothetical protein [Alphaproteobacteria bacterium]